MARQLDLLKTVERAEWSVAGEIAVKLVLVAVPLRPRPDFKTRKARLKTAPTASSPATRNAARGQRWNETDIYSKLTSNYAVEVTAKIRTV